MLPGELSESQARKLLLNLVKQIPNLHFSENLLPS